ncbi:hypothetical protein [Solibacillus ferritrahens]|uniref:hypothetical protein n=1 Tax=Solibacillus ferritrahens TaxID=3098620 RepID=UPI003009FED8
MNRKIIKGEVIAELANELAPGIGAVNFAQELIEQYGDEYPDEALLFRDIESDRPEIFEDKRVRRCSACGHYFRDQSKGNQAITCSDDCRAKKNVFLRRLKRQDSATGPSNYSEAYGFYADDQALMDDNIKHRVDTPDYEKTIARSQIRQLNGGKKRVTTQNIDDIKSRGIKRSREFWGTTWATAYEDDDK